MGIKKGDLTRYLKTKLLPLFGGGGSCIKGPGAKTNGLLLQGVVLDRSQNMGSHLVSYVSRLHWFPLSALYGGARPWRSPDTSSDPLDNRATRTVAGANLSHSVDAANQLQTINEGATPKAAFVYDANGNLAQKCEGTGVTGTSTSCSGSIVTTLTWNPLDQLTAVTKTGVPSETYQYDPQGRRISKTVGAVTTHYRYNGDDIDAEYSQTWNEIARYVHGAGVDDPLMRLTGNTANPDAQTRYYAQNGINSVVAYFGDIAQGAAVIATSVTATNSYNASAYPPAKLIDGDTSGTSVWGGNLASGPASFTLELGAVRPISRLTLYKANFGSSYNVKDVQVQIRNGGIWSSVGSPTSPLFQ